MTAWAFKDVYEWLYAKLWKKVGVSVAITVVLIYITILLPLAFFANIAIQQSLLLSKDINNLIAGRSFNVDTVVLTINQTTAQIPGIETEFTRAEILQYIEEIARPVGNFLLDKAIALGGSTPDIVARTILFTIVVITFLPQSDKFIGYLKKLSPLDDELNDLYIRRALAMTSSMIKGTFVVSFVQALLAVSVLWFVGVDYLVVLFGLMLVLGIIPVVGATTVMVPIGLFYLFTGAIWQGLLIILTTVIIISNLDNILRPMLVSKEAMISPALIILGVFGGLSMFGALGIIYGPVLMIVLITTLEIYTKYYPIRK